MQFRDVQVRIFMAKSHGPLKPLFGATHILLISPNRPDVVSRRRVAAAIGAVVPIKSCRSIGTDTLSGIVTMPHARLSVHVTTFCGGQEQTESTTKVPLVVSTTKQWCWVIGRSSQSRSH
jgi:hypothetical protein